MSTKKPTKSELQKKAIERRRKEPDFLPEYSDYYFEKKKQYKSLVSFLLIYFTLAFGIVAYLAHKEYSFLFFVAFIFLLVWIFILFPRIQNRQKICGTTFAPHAMIQTHFWSGETQIPYSKMEEAIVKDGILFADTGIQIGSGSDKLMFHYEIGNADAQKHIEQCYKEFQRHIATKLPPYEKKGLELLDHRFFYEKSRRNQTISLVFAELFSLSIFTGISAQTGVVLGVSLFFCLWECYSLYLLFKSAILTEKNNTSLRLLFGSDPRLKIGKPWSGYLRFGITAAAVVFLNLLLYFYF